MDPNILKEIIKKDIKNKANKYVARKFYYETETQDTIIDSYSNGNIKTTIKKGQTIKINYLKQLVSQKIDYILSKPVSASNKQFNWDDIFSNMMLNASLDVASWLHLFVRKGKLDWIIINDIEIIPFYHNTKYIHELIRYFPTIEGKYSVEYWINKKVMYYEYDQANDKIILLNAKAHYKTITMYQGEIENVDEKHFDSIPFIPLFNNRNHESDANDIISLLNMYNNICSGFIDNINEFQEAIIILKNFSGTPEALEEAMENMRKHKSVGVPADGDVGKLLIDIPVEARQVILTIIKDAIYSLGRGVDIDKLINTHITNVFIKTRFQSLDFKANDTIAQCKLFYDKVIDFINDYDNKKHKSNLVFNKTLISNETEQVTAIVEGVKLRDAGLISNETLMEQIPWISNIDEELKQIAKEKATMDMTKEDPNSSSKM